MSSNIYKKLKWHYSLKVMNDWNCQRETKNMDLLGEQAERVNVSYSVLELEKKRWGPCMHPFIRKIPTCKIRKWMSD